MDSYEFDLTPYEEDCVMVGSEGYKEKAHLEYRAIVEQIKRQFGIPPVSVIFKFKHSPHDFGTYYELQVIYNEDSEEACQYISNIEQDFPQTWDKESRRFLKENGY